MKRLRIAVVLVLAVLTQVAVAATPQRPVPAIERVVIVSVDGLRPDLLIRAKTPHIRSLIDSGTFTFWARTTEMAVTLPSHVSMLTGLPPEKHGITWNDDRITDVLVAAPTVFELAKNAGYSTAMVAGKMKFAVLLKPGTLDQSYLPEKGRKDDDASVGRRAAEVVRSLRPQLLMVHFPANDSNGHRFRWGAAEQIEGLAATDAALGAVLTALDETGVRATTLIILTADHGGQGGTHGPGDPRSRFIPFIASGPTVLKNHDLDTNAASSVNVEDTFATALYVLGVPLPDRKSVV